MGGGELAQALREKARDTEVVMSASAAATVHHNPDRVLSYGIRVVDDRTAEELASGNRYSTLMAADLEIDRLHQITRSFGVPFAFDAIGVCAQDHGVPPPGVSHLDFRHNCFETILGQQPFPHALLYPEADIPAPFSRLRAIAASARQLPAEDVYVMDSGMAAIIGASMDVQARAKSRVVVLDIATSHTVGAALQDGELGGFFEYHTKDLTLGRLEQLLRELADDRLDHGRILAEGGHGAYTRTGFGFERVEAIIATGPKRALIAQSDLSILRGAPLGDNMMTGTVGLLEAIRRRRHLPELVYA
jgi:uncharacterized protein (DUF1786 family)